MEKKLSGTALVNGGDQSKRKESDYYPTPPQVTHALMKHLYENDLIDRSDKVWEPACGEGDMSEVIQLYNPNVFSSDLNDTGYGTPFTDFLTAQAPSDCFAIITNPPFKLSVEFIEKATQQSRLTCMLLKSQYWHALERLELFKELPPAYVCPLTWRPDFLFKTRKPGDKVAPTMEAGWSIWIKGQKRSTIYQPLRKPKV